MGALASSPGSKDFIEAFAYAQRGIAIRHMLGNLRFLYRNKEWNKTCRTVASVCDGYVEKVLARLQSESPDEKEKPELGEEKSLHLVDEMAKETQDRIACAARWLECLVRRMTVPQ